VTPEDVLAFWFGELDASGRADEIHRKQWFASDPAFDEKIRQQFKALHEEIAGAGHREWRTSDRGLLASVVVLDQFSRNMFRGTAKAFAADPLAQELANAAVAAGADRAARYDERGFVYLPFTHAEDLATQNRAVALFESWAAELSPSLADGALTQLRYAVMHRDIVARFGRFPHRNKALGRESTPDEQAFLASGKSGFGQA
jgi:uncharacterized protein (DUF924 family)